MITGKFDLPGMMQPQISLEQTVAKLKKSLDYSKVLKEINFEKMSISQLLNLHRYLMETTCHFEDTYASEGRKLLFEVKDFLFRRIAGDVTKINEVLSLIDEHSPLKKDLLRLHPDHSVFIPINKLVKAAAEGVFLDTRPQSKKKDVKALHISIEYENAIQGGVGVVAIQLLRKMQEAKLNASIVTPLYDLYKGDAAFKEARYVGMIEHEYEGKIVKSTIYKVKGKGDVPHYVIKADPAFLTVFDIKAGKNVYEPIQGGSSGMERFYYLASAVAAMAATYQGGRLNKRFDILHFHSWFPAFAAHILKSKYAPLLAKAQLPPIYSVQHFHHGSLADHCIVSSSVYKTLGITDVPNVATANTQEDIWLHVDGVSFVSERAAQDSITVERGEGLHKVAQHLHQNGRLTSVPNGIILEEHALASKIAHGSFAVNQLLDVNGVDITDYFSEKNKIKKTLFEAGIIADPIKPLFIYVGRYCSEKGIDKLEGMAESIIASGGQCCIMGWGHAEGYTPSTIKALQRFAENNKATMRVYTTPREQTDLFHDSGATKGNLIRAASDFLLMPSKFEGCALVVWEAIARGNLIISSMGGGLKTQCRTMEDVGEQEFNAFGYQNNEFAEENAAEAIRNALAFYNKKIVDPKQWNQVVANVLRQSQRNDWLNNAGPIARIQEFYRSIMKPQTPEEKKNHDALVSEYYEKNRSKVRYVISKTLSLSNKALEWIVVKIKNFVRGFFRSFNHVGITVQQIINYMIIPLRRIFKTKRAVVT